MSKMWSSNEEFDFETARDYASKLVLLGSAQRAGIFEALLEEKDIAALKHMLNADERALFIVLEALCALGYVHKRQDRYIISGKARTLFLERGEEYVGGSLPHFLDMMNAWLKLPGIIKGAKPEREEKHDVSAFMNAMASRPDKVVEETVDHCLKRKSNAKNVLDLGGGPGKYTKAFVNRGLNAVLYDLPDAIDYLNPLPSFGGRFLRSYNLSAALIFIDRISDYIIRSLSYSLLRFNRRSALALVPYTKARRNYVPSNRRLNNP